MPFKKGQPRAVGAGRKAGTPNKRTLAQAACAKHKADPFGFLASVVVDVGADIKERIACAKELCEYLEPKLSRQEVTTEDGEGSARGYLLIPVKSK